MTGKSNSPTNISKLPSIASSNLLCSLNISVWEGRKKDKTIEEEIAHDKGARSRRAASVYKNLFVDAPALEAIKSLRGEARIYINKYTQPWNDNGERLLPCQTYYEEVQAGMEKYAKRFDQLVNVLAANWNTEISKQAFERGAMFDRNEYPSVEDIKDKFQFNFSIRPVPLAGDFRVDVGTEALQKLQELYSAETERCVQRAMTDAWQRVKEQVEWVRERMDAVLQHEEGTDEDGKKKHRPKLYESMLDTGMELCEILKSLNVTNDPALEEARHMLEKALVHTDINSLKESKEVQTKLKSAMDEIADKFDW